MKKAVKIISALVIGFAVAMLAMTTAIFFGYTKAYATDVEVALIKLIGIPIYKLTKSGSEYVGESQGAFMGLVCGIGMALGVIAEEVIARIKKK